MGKRRAIPIGASTQYPYELLVNVTRLHDTYKLYRVRDFTKVRVELHESYIMIQVRALSISTLTLTIVTRYNSMRIKFLI